LEIPAKKILLTKFIQQQCSPGEMAEVLKLMEADGQQALEEILDEAWEEIPAFPALEADIAAEIWQHLCQTTGIFASPAPSGLKKELLPASPASWCFLAAGLALVLVMLVLPRK
jgi:hypothetical protein